VSINCRRRTKIDERRFAPARRFGKQIFLSVDVPASMGDDSGNLVRVEKVLMDTLREMEKK
jgi:hypothetical protein